MSSDSKKPAKSSVEALPLSPSQFNDSTVLLCSITETIAKKIINSSMM